MTASTRRPLLGLGVVLATLVVCAVPARAMTLPEAVPDFSLDTTRPSVMSAQSGPWASASTWQGGVLPSANHVVHVMAGHTVTINGTTAVGYTIAVDGTLRFDPTVTTSLTVTNLMVMPGT